MNNTSILKKPFPVAGIFFIVYGAARLLISIYSCIEDYVLRGYSFSILTAIDEATTFIFALSLLTLGIMLLVIRKNTPFLLIPFGINILFELYWLYNDFSFIIGDDIYDIVVVALGYFFIISVFILLALFCILSYRAKEKKCPILIVWFIPGIIAFLTYVLFNYDIFKEIYIDTSLFFILLDTSKTYLINLLFLFTHLVPAIFLLGYWLYKENNYKVLSATPMTIPSFEEDNAQIAYTPSADSYYNEPVQMDYNQTPVYNKPTPTQSYSFTPPVNQPVYDQSPPAPQMHPTEEIARYKKLLDEGAITPEEYEFKKKQILGF